MTNVDVLRVNLQVGSVLPILVVLIGELNLAHLSLNLLDSSFKGRMQHSNSLQTFVEINMEGMELLTIHQLIHVWRWHGLGPWSRRWRRLAGG